MPSATTVSGKNISTCRLLRHHRKKHSLRQKMSLPPPLEKTITEPSSGLSGLGTTAAVLTSEQRTGRDTGPTKKILSEDEIRQLWNNPKFSGAFSGINNFQACLEMEKGVKLSKHRLFTIMRKDPNFLVESRKIYRTFPRRRIKVHGVGQVWQADLGFMYEYDNFIGFLLCIDLFSRKLFCKIIKKKDQATVQKAFDDIFKEAKMTPSKLETDQGQEFLSNRKFFSKNQIYLKIKTGAQKAAFAESAIKTVKHRLYRLLRGLLTKDWPKYFYDIVTNINNSKLNAIGGLRPNDIISPLDDPKIDQAIGIPEDVSFEDQVQNQKKYEKDKTKLQKGDFVLADFGPSAFAKGFDSPNYQIFQIERVDAGKQPPLYSLIDLDKDKVKGYFYREQLRKTRPPTPQETFRIEKIVRERERNGETEVLVKYLHYPSKFNLWCLKKDVVNNEDEEDK